MSHPALPRLLGALLAVSIPSAGARLAAQQPSPTPPRTDAAEQPGELGAISWWRDEAAARRAAEASRKPLLVLFQEVPG
ncbi:MAG: hypothetical protein KAI24_04430 [Planctomycetes bacterium]|nr:hypothetical protein [Planctomycetota bacterium]